MGIFDLDRMKSAQQASMGQGRPAEASGAQSRVCRSGAPAERRTGPADPEAPAPVEVLEHPGAGGAVAVAMAAAQVDQSGPVPDVKVCLRGELADVQVLGRLLPVPEFSVSQSAVDGQRIDGRSVLDQSVEVLYRRVPCASGLALQRLLVVPAEELLAGGGERPGVLAQQGLVGLSQLGRRDGHGRAPGIDPRGREDFGRPEQIVHRAIIRLEVPQ